MGDIEAIIALLLNPTPVTSVTEPVTEEAEGEEATDTVAVITLEEEEDTPVTLTTDATTDTDETAAATTDTTTTTTETKEAEDTDDTTATTATTTATTTTTTTSTVTAAVLAAKVTELKAKYYVASSGDPFSISNPQLVSFKKALSDGVIEALTSAGFSSSDILNVVSQVFPDIGIKATSNGGYTLPYGHGAEAKTVYTSFKDKMAKTKGTSAEIEALKNEISAVQYKIENYTGKIEQIKSTIEALKEKIEKAIEDALEEAEDVTEAQKEEAGKIVDEELSAYISASGSMTYEEFQNSLSSRLNDLSTTGSSKIASITSDILLAKSNMPVLNNYITLMGTYITNVNTLNATLTTKTASLTKLQEAAAAAANSNVTQTDPIGFMDQNGTKYDFFSDTDSNGKLSNENEFLGAKNGWKEIAALDTDGNGKVSGKELKAANIKVVVTDSAGNQSIKNASDVIDDDDYVDLKSYNTKNSDLGNNNTLLGTFSLNIDGTTNTSGYNTLDDLSWLDSNYNFSDKDEGKNRFAQSDSRKITVDTTQYTKDVNGFKEDYTKLETKLNDAITKLSLDKDDLNDIVLLIEKEGKSNAESLSKTFEEIKLKEQTYE